jgi:DNA-binding transcriptional LysR family regulator
VTEICDLQPRIGLPRPSAGDRRAVVDRLGLGVPDEYPDGPADIAAYAEQTWIVNSRNTADETAVRTLASLAGFVPRIAHEIDSLELVEDLIVTGYGVGLPPILRQTPARFAPIPRGRNPLLSYRACRRSSFL